MSNCINGLSSRNSFENKRNENSSLNPWWDIFHLVAFVDLMPNFTGPGVSDDYMKRRFLSTLKLRSFASGGSSDWSTIEIIPQGLTN